MPKLRKGDSMFIFGFTISMAVIWLIVAILLLIIEALTIGLTTIWFAVGAVIALIAALLNFALWVQIGLFTICSVCLLAFTRKFFVEKLRTGAEKTNTEAILGETAIVLTSIKPLSVGRVKVNGQEWAAIGLAENMEIAEGSLVKVTAIEGVKLVVIPIQ